MGADPLLFNNQTQTIQPRMQLDTLTLPIDWQKTRIHCEANRLGKRDLTSKDLPQSLPHYGQVCEQCGRRATHCPRFRPLQPQHQLTERYGKYGPNCVIFLGFIKRIGIFMFVSSILFSVPLLVYNLSGRVCATTDKACSSQDIIYGWSVYNVIGEGAGSLPHHIVWLVFSCVACVFSLYLRKYSVETYRMINNRNITDDDFAVMLRRLPHGTTEEDVRELVEKQVLEEYVGRAEQAGGKVVEELSKLKAMDVIMIYRFTELMEANNKNVQNLKKHHKAKQKNAEMEDFQPETLPIVTRFAHAAIVRFEDTRGKDLLTSTRRLFCQGKTINYFFPFYNAKTQYMVNEHNVSLEAAPAPTDIIWENIGFTQSIRALRKLIVNVVSILLLLVSAGISVAISLWIESNLNGTGVSPILLTIILVLFNAVFNFLIELILRLCIKQIKLDTRTDEECEILTIITFSSSISIGFISIFAPIISKLPSFIQVDTSDSATFPLVMFTSIIVMSFLGVSIHFVLEYCQIAQSVLKMLIKFKLIVKTQTEAYETFKGTEVPFTWAYSHCIQLVWFGFIYSVVSPICALIATAGMLVFYLYQKSLFNSKYSIPIYMGPRINAILIDLLDFTAVLIGTFNLFLYTTSNTRRNVESEIRVMGVIYANIALGAVFAVLPWRNFVSQYYGERVSLTVEKFNRADHYKTYENCYPAGKKDIHIANVKTQAQIEAEKQPIDVKEYLAALQSSGNINAKSQCCM